MNIHLIQRDYDEFIRLLVRNFEDSIYVEYTIMEDRVSVGTYTPKGEGNFIDVYPDTMEKYSPRHMMRIVRAMENDSEKKFDSSSNTLLSNYAP